MNDEKSERRSPSEEYADLKKLSFEMETLENLEFLGSDFFSFKGTGPNRKAFISFEKIFALKEGKIVVDLSLDEIHRLLKALHDDARAIISSVEPRLDLLRRAMAHPDPEKANINRAVQRYKEKAQRANKFISLIDLLIRKVTTAIIEIQQTITLPEGKERLKEIADFFKMVNEYTEATDHVKKTYEEFDRVVKSLTPPGVENSSE